MNKIKILKKLVLPAFITPPTLLTSSCLLSLDKDIYEKYNYGKNHHFLTIKKYAEINNISDPKIIELEEKIRKAIYATFNPYTTEFAYWPSNLNKIDSSISYLEVRKIFNYYFNDTAFEYWYRSQNLLKNNLNQAEFTDYAISLPSGDIIDNYYWDQIKEIMKANKGNFKSAYQEFLKFLVNNNARINYSNFKSENDFKGFIYALPAIFVLKNREFDYKKPDDKTRLFKKIITDSLEIKKYIQNPKAFLEATKDNQYSLDYYKELYKNNKNIYDSIKESMEEIKDEIVPNWGVTADTFARNIATILFVSGFEDLHLLKAYDDTPVKDSNGNVIFEKGRIVYYFEKKNSQGEWEIFDVIKDFENLQQDINSTINDEKALPTSWKYKIDNGTETSKIQHFRAYSVNDGSKLETINEQIQSLIKDSFTNEDLRHIKK